MMPEYARICGYSEEEIIRYFPDYLKDTAVEMKISMEELIVRMCRYYNGFSFDDKAKIRLYNPYSTLLFFMYKRFSNYWFQTATTKFMADYLKDWNLTVEQFRYYQAPYFFLENPGDMDTTLPRILSSIPYDDYTKAALQSISNNDYDMTPQEWLYRSNILSFLRGCGVVVVAEMHTNMGRADLVVTHKGQTWVIEIKVAYEGQSVEEKADEAFRQLSDKNYAGPFPDATGLALAIDDAERKITASRILKYQD